MEQFERIRLDARDKDMSIRELAAFHKVHRRTVRAALVSSTPPARKPAVRAAPVLGPWLPLITQWLIEDLEAPPKQRHTGRRIWQRLVEEHDAQVSESAVTHAVGRIRRDLVGKVAKVAVMQTHAPGGESEVDFGEFWAVIAGVKVKLWMFVMRLSFSGRAIHVAYGNQTQESFLDGHGLAFERFGGVPAKMIRYDNLTPAVIRVLLGRERLENPRFIAMRSHYGFDSFFCIPGIDGAHEKGGVEGEIGRFRRRWLTPVPIFDSLAELNAYMAGCDAKDDDRVIGHKPATISTMFDHETPLLRSAPADVFDAAVMLSFKADHKAQVCVRQCYYSVPARFAGRRVSVRLSARGVEMFADGAKVASHVRAVHKYSYVLELDHYLEVLATKPGALAGATALVAARSSGVFTDAHQRFWDKARLVVGDGAGTRALIEVLLLARTLPAEAIIHAMAHALSSGDFDAEHIAITARHYDQTRTRGPVGTVMILEPDIAERLNHLPIRTTPSLASYDRLLTTAGETR